MTPAALLYSAGLMGCLALAGGGYGGLYTWSRMRLNAGLRYTAFVCYGLVLLFAVLIAASTPLAPVWKTLVVASALIYALVPPLTWRFLVKMHEPGEQHP
ncbi:MAG: hypothetical protein KGL98_06725 [Gammaproteobacteria bacterium]|nr:hypothetical protein [Gammaproteobacteria bacterium]MBU6508742.1 hypothetical protein [Gammaproteobacteria bacterium]MDE1983048.1 hypothetical protein [Gammaproteobacteria bacterium]MDE2107633.1 hypothetical protein [Gammaproteobacteria bacterium]MDE2460926.1 hypothetical protein [Gammaproteobacteria bacterium]